MKRTTKTAVSVLLTVLMLLAVFSAASAEPGTEESYPGNTAEEETLNSSAEEPLDLPGEPETGRTYEYFGDLDRDSSITAADARLALRIAVGLAETQSEDVSADADLDGEITADDARLLLRIAVGLDSYFALFSDRYEFTCPAGDGKTHSYSFSDGVNTYNVTEGCSVRTVGLTPASCLSDGEKICRCGVCGYETDTALPATGHSFTGKAVSDGEGMHFYECVNGCVEKTEKTACEYTASVRTPARCGVTGVTAYTCGKCGHSYTLENIPALTHSFTTYTPDGNATWQKDGTKTARCDNPGCTAVLTVTDPGSRLNSSFIPKNIKVLYLTFDDGPSKYTKDIIRILEEHGAKATWFVIHTDTYTSGYKAIVDSGNAIALHSYTHDYSKIYSSVTGFYNDLNRISDEVYKYTGVRTHLYRFPGGSSNTVSRSYCRGIMSTLTKSVEKNGYVYFDWNAANNDATGKYMTPSQLYSSAISFCGPNRVVMLMHDTNAKYNTVASLGDIIDYYKARGYYCLALDEYSETAHHGIAN